MSQKESVEKIKNDDSDVIEYGEFQSPKLTRKPTMIMPSAPLKSAFKRRLIPLSESDDDLFDDDIKTPLSDIDEEVKIHNDDTEHDGEIIEVGKNKRESPRIRFCFTYNNPKCSGEEFKKYLEDKGKIALAVFQLEKGANGTLHFQGYWECKQKMRTTALQTMLGIHKCKLLYANGTKQQNHKYCTKDDTREDGPWYIGNPEDFKKKRGKQGTRNDLDEFALVCLEEGGITTKVEEEYASVLIFSQKIPWG